MNPESLPKTLAIEGDFGHRKCLGKICTHLEDNRHKVIACELCGASVSADQIAEFIRGKGAKFSKKMNPYYEIICKAKRRGYYIVIYPAGWNDDGVKMIQLTCEVCCDLIMEDFGNE
mmetsp:Transcript_100398/g.122921  ORF Transcript_100398/g.122921 Transcript_100398/m.122921 type:complete len:117 (+) Transcript_100398:76-426(+)